MLLSAPWLRASGFEMPKRGDFQAPEPKMKQSRTQPAEKLPSQPAKKWTVMAFLDAKNNLEDAIFNNMQQMELVGSDDSINIVAEIGRMAGQGGETDQDRQWTGTRRYYIKRDYFPQAADEKGRRKELKQAMSRINSPYEDLGKTDMGSYEEAVRFIGWAKKKFPAERYMLVLSDHGGGWRDPKKKQKISQSAISWDDETGNFIGTAQIEQLVREAGGVDVLVYDACLMQMAEIAYQMRGSGGAKVVVGSEELFPGEGIDYAGFLGRLARNPGGGPEEAGKHAVTAAGSFYGGLEKGYVTLSALRTEGLDGLAERMEKWASAAAKAGDIAEAARHARNNVLRFGEFGQGDQQRIAPTYGDLYDFVRLAGGKTKDRALREASAELMRYISDGKSLVLANMALGSSGAADYSSAHGLAVNIPRIFSKVKPEDFEADYNGNDYADFAFAKATPKWQTFCRWMYDKLPSDKKRG